MLINCVAYQAGRKLSDITIEEISDYVAMPDCFVWVALKDPGPGELALMQHEFGLHELAVEDARHGHQRPKIEEYGDSLFAVLHMIEQEDDGDLTVGEVAVFVGRNYILSVRNRAKKGFRDVRARCEKEPELLKNGSAFVLYALMDSVVDRYFPVLANLEAELEQVEDRIFEKGAPARQIIEDLYSLKRKLVQLQHAASPLLESVSKLYGGRVPPICASMQDYFRDVYDHLLRITRDIEARRDMVTTAMQVDIAMITLAEGEITKQLASYGALFAVPTMIAGVYGMNFEFMPELHWTFGYPLAMISMVVADVILYWRFKKSGWL